MSTREQTVVSTDLPSALSALIPDEERAACIRAWRTYPQRARQAFVDTHGATVEVAEWLRRWTRMVVASEAERDANIAFGTAALRAEAAQAVAALDTVADAVKVDAAVVAAWCEEQLAQRLRGIEGAA